MLQECSYLEKEFQRIIFHTPIRPVLPPEPFLLDIAATKSAVTIFLPLEVLKPRKASQKHL